jgi:membrane-associated protease RseP (regulator of RpoE activity)
MGSLNFALFVFNLIPLLPLDGGHAAGAIYEGLKRRTFKSFGKKDPGPVDTAKMIPVAYGVWALLMGTGLLLIVADIVNPISIFG